MCSSPGDDAGSILGIENVFCWSGGGGGTRITPTAPYPTCDSSGGDGGGGGAATDSKEELLLLLAPPPPPLSSPPLLPEKWLLFCVHISGTFRGFS